MTSVKETQFERLGLSRVPVLSDKEGFVGKDGSPTQRHRLLYFRRGAILLYSLSFSGSNSLYGTSLS